MTNTLLARTHKPSIHLDGVLLTDQVLQTHLSRLNSLVSSSSEDRALLLAAAASLQSVLLLADPVPPRLLRLLSPPSLLADRLDTLDRPRCRAGTPSWGTSGTGILSALLDGDEKGSDATPAPVAGAAKGLRGAALPDCACGVGGRGREEGEVWFDWRTCEAGRKHVTRPEINSASVEANTLTL